MTADRLPNYLSSYRKNGGFTQEELAWLVGLTNGARVSRYESAAQTPELKTILAYEMVFQAPARELFGGIHDAVAFATRKRMRTMLRQLARGEQDALTQAKVAALRAALASMAPRSFHGDDA